MPVRLLLVVPALLLTVGLLAAAPAAALPRCATGPGFLVVPFVACAASASIGPTNAGCEVMLNPQPEPPGLPFATACASAVFVAGQAASCNVRVGPSLFLPPGPCVLRPTET